MRKLGTAFLFIQRKSDSAASMIRCTQSDEKLLFITWQKRSLSRAIFVLLKRRKVNEKGYALVLENFMENGRIGRINRAERGSNYYRGVKRWKEEKREKREKKKLNEPFVQRAQFHPRAVLVTV